VGVLPIRRTDQHARFDYEHKQHRIWGLGKDNNEDWLRNHSTPVSYEMHIRSFSNQSYVTAPYTSQLAQLRV
jgi:hypothetical protein